MKIRVSWCRAQRQLFLHVFTCLNTLYSAIVFIKILCELIIPLWPSFDIAHSYCGILYKFLVSVFLFAWAFRENGVLESTLRTVHSFWNSYHTLICTGHYCSLFKIVCRYCCGNLHHTLTRLTFLKNFP